MKILILMLFSFFSIQTSACDCDMSSLENSYNNSDVIFTGKVIRTDPLDYRVKSESFYTASVTIFQPEEVFKSSPYEITQDNGNFSEVFIIQGDTNCSMYFENEKRYLIFGKRSAWGVYVTGLCLGSTTFAKASSRIEKLRKIKSLYNEINKP